MVLEVLFSGKPSQAPTWHEPTASHKLLSKNFQEFGITPTNEWLDIGMLLSIMAFRIDATGCLVGAARFLAQEQLSNTLVSRDIL
jgi:hypothetical protein